MRVRLKKERENERLLKAQFSFSIVNSIFHSSSTLKLVKKKTKSLKRANAIIFINFLPIVIFFPSKNFLRSSEEEGKKFFEDLIYLLDFLIFLNGIIFIGGTWLWIMGWMSPADLFLPLKTKGPSNIAWINWDDELSFFVRGLSRQTLRLKKRWILFHATVLKRVESLIRD